ncbi:diguanylate cyclase [Neokomagataea thailandica NBRC 106555]|nr:MULTISPECIES: diguanylate cyclase [Neokomagataea]GBR54680.1 diguanylate cyclase [Neokomagataea thailandica NBRC 106555]
MNKETEPTLDSLKSTQTALPPHAFEHAEAILHAIDQSAGVIILDNDRKVIFKNTKFDDIDRRLKNSENSPLISSLQKINIESKNYHKEISVRGLKNKTYWLDITCSQFTSPTKIDIFIIIDITPHKLTEEHLRSNKKMLQLALSVDNLTGIANRNAFSVHLKTILEKENKDKRFCIGIIDIDHFKKANDTLGHKAGDKLLKKISRILKGFQSNSIFVARVGGDEFAIIIDNDDYIVLSNILNDILHSLKFTFSFDGILHNSSASIGYTITTAHTKTNISDALHEPDMALYQAKEMGGNQIYLYDNQLSERYEQRLKLLSDILTSFKKEKFPTLYSPTFSTNGGDILLFSTSIDCYNSENIELKNDDTFKQQVDKYYIENTYKEIRKTINNNGKLYFSLKINNSKDIDKYSINHIDRIIHEYNLKSAIEIDHENSNYILNFVDDTCMSLPHTRDLQCKYIKIGGDLIKYLPDTPTNKIIVESIINVAHSVGKKVIATDVASKECDLILRQLGCDYVEGAFYSPNLTLTEVYALVAQTSSSHD